MQKRIFCCFALSCILAALPAFSTAQEQVKSKKKLFLIGMKTDHAPGEHEYMAGLNLLSECLQQTPNLEVKVLKVLEKSKGWPEEAKGIEEANAIVCFLKVGGTYFLGDPERRKTTEETLKKGAGFVALHW